MSLVTTAIWNLPASSRHTIAISELLPVPTGPQTPSLRALVESGTEQPPGGAGMDLRPVLDLGRTGRGDVGCRRQQADLVGQPVHVREKLEAPRHRVCRIEREELERGGQD